MTQKSLIEVMLKHLPPSSSTLQLWDVEQNAASVFQAQRHDIHITPLPKQATQWPQQDNVADSITTTDADLSPEFLAAALRLLRPGGRLIMLQPQGKPDKAIVQTLENAGYIRILVEPALTEPTPQGALIRGEKPHTTHSTFARIRVAADQDEDNLTLDTYDGAYIFLLVRQSPNKPVWALREDETLQWDAVLANGRLLAFTSLPKAVSFMQPAVMQEVVVGINKVGKFSKQTAQTWSQSVELNPTLDTVKSQTITFMSIDPNTAEAPDE